MTLPELNSLPLLLLLLASGIAAGFINTLAGGGSFLTIPVLMLMGIPADLANATNRVGVMVQALEGMRGFHRHGALPTGAIIGMLIPCGCGALIGALTASYLPLSLLKPVILLGLCGMALWMVLQPNMLTPPADSRPIAITSSPKGFVALFAAGLYGGFLQAGVGFALIAALVGVLRFDLVAGNALKMVATGVFTLIALVVFIARDQILWLPGLVLAAGSFVGVRLAVDFAIRVNQQVLRWLVLVAVVAATLFIGLSD